MGNPTGSVFRLDGDVVNDFPNSLTIVQIEQGSWSEHVDEIFQWCGQRRVIDYTTYKEM